MKHGIGRTVWIDLLCERGACARELMEEVTLCLNNPSTLLRRACPHIRQCTRELIIVP
jgi:hypothetical protein